MAKPVYYFSEEERISACYHEVGHAIIFSLGDTSVKKIMVHAVGSEENCDVYDGYGACFIEQYLLEDLSTTNARAYACGVFAGYVAQSIHAGKWCDYHSISDTEKLKDIIESLPGGMSELANIKSETSRALALNWSRVSKLAEIVNRFGEVDFEANKKAKKLLPPPFCGIKKWPSVPKISTGEVKLLDNSQLSASN